MADDTSIGLLLIIGIIAVVFLVPFPLIWAINTLWGTHTPYGFWEWLAGLVFILLLAGSARASRE